MSTENRGAKAANAMFGYALVMLIAGMVAFGLAPVGANPVTALVVPAAFAVLMIACGLMARAIGSKYVLGMVGIHLGLVFPILFAAMTAFRALKVDDPEKAYLRNTLWFLAAASVIAFFVILSRRPQKEQRGG